jgi:hypothetical protein
VSSAQGADQHTVTRAASPSHCRLARLLPICAADVPFTDPLQVRAARAQRSSKYIEGLLDKAKERQREQDIVYERR